MCVMILAMYHKKEFNKFGFVGFFCFAQSDSVFVGDGFPVPKKQR